jgi:hypothetical protein
MPFESSPGHKRPSLRTRSTWPDGCASLGPSQIGRTKLRTALAVLSRATARRPYPILKSAAPASSNATIAAMAGASLLTIFMVPPYPSQIGT